MGSDEKAIYLGHPSYVWRSGQDRRLDMIQEHAPLEGARVLDIGCGVGAYVSKMAPLSRAAFGIDVDEAKVREALDVCTCVCVSGSEHLPFPDASFDRVLLNEVIEHVEDDRQTIRESFRVLAPGGRIIIFAPNRLYPFETHGIFWRGSYRFGNIPLVNYMPNRWRDRLCPHVRAYTSRGLSRLFDGLPARVVIHTQIYPGYDNIARRAPALAGVLRRLTYLAEHTGLRAFGLSHLLVVEKATRSDERPIPGAQR